MVSIKLCYIDGAWRELNMYSGQGLFRSNEYPIEFITAICRI